MNVYEKADKRIADFLAWIAFSFNSFRARLNRRSDTLAVFDELNTLYQQINTYSREMFLAILQDAYDDEAKQRRRRFTEDFLIVILDDPNDFTTVTYSKELERKSERLSEQLAAAIHRS